MQNTPQLLSSPLASGIKSFRGLKRRFLLLRVSGLDKEQARITSGVKEGTYNTWCNDPIFKDFYGQVDVLSVDYRKEAITFLRRDNQLQAVLLEGKIIDKMREEVDTGEYNLVRTHLAREVYNRLLSEMDFQPAIQSRTWNQRIGELIVQRQEVIDATYSEATTSQEEELTEGSLISEGE